MVSYRIDVSENAYERVVACADLFRHKRFLIIIERDGKANYYVKFQVDDYLYGYLKSDLTNLSSTRVRLGLVKRLTDLREEEIELIRKEFPLSLLDEAFKEIVPELYCENTRVRSSKYKRLLSNYGLYERAYLNMYHGADRLVLSEFGL